MRASTSLPVCIVILLPLCILRFHLCAPSYRVQKVTDPEGCSRLYAIFLFIHNDNVDNDDDRKKNIGVKKNIAINNDLQENKYLYNIYMLYIYTYILVAERIMKNV